MYTIPIITSTDLRREETIIQAANSLEYLQFIINDVFLKINRRIEKNSGKIDEIQSRIDRASTKINGLIGSKKAIKIFSPAKFPSTHVFSDIPITFDPICNPPENFNFNNDDYEVESNLEPINQSVLQEKLAFFFIACEQQKTNLSKILDSQHHQLGSIPRDIASVNTMLLYNTTKNVYSCIKDAYDPKDRNHLNRNEVTLGHKIEAAPVSITNRQIKDNKFNQKLFYTPKLNDAPTINLPVDLPDLPGIADDVQFQIEEDEKIAPSLFFEGLHNLRDIPIDPIDAIESDDIFDQQKTNEDLQELPSQPLIAVPPPPPPPPLMEPPLPIPKAVPKISALKSESNTKMVVTDARSNLMDAIRKAGGSKALKSSAASEVIVSKSSNNKIEEVKKPAMNLMDDLHNKLMMRRKGISGAKENISTGTMMDKLASIIPPPPKPSLNVSSDNSSDNDEDWDA